MPSATFSDGTLRGVTRRADGNMKHEEARTTALLAVKVGGLDLAGKPVFFPSQKHGTVIVSIGAASDPSVHPEADGLITDTPGFILCVFAADCMPIFVWEKSGRAAGVFHAGWRGAAAGMPRQAAQAFQERYGIGAGDLKAEIGPHIHPCCFRVGPETAAKFPSSSVVRREDGLYVDLAREAGRQLLEAGMGEAAVFPKLGRFERDGRQYTEVAGRVMGVRRACTCCQPEEFFSYRREKSDNRMMAFTVLSGAR